MSFKTEIRDGWLWPVSDTELWKVARDYTILEMALEHCKHRRVAIQAGGACGTFPNWLSQYFETVYTFEPDPVNFTCLVANCQQPNVVKMQAALGSKLEHHSLVVMGANCGAGYVSRWPGPLPTVALDTVYEGAVDLIQLDVEGMETLALDGAMSLVKDSYPVIVIENKGHGSRYSEIPPVAWLVGMGYSQVGAYARDLIFARA